MNDRTGHAPAPEVAPDHESTTLAPLPGEHGIPDLAQRQSTPLSRKALVAAALLTTSLIAVSAISIERFTAGGKKTDDAATTRASDRPAAATTEPRRFDLTPAPIAASTPQPRVPAIVRTREDEVEPIGVRRTGQGAATPRPALPEDAPVLLVSSRPAPMTTDRGAAAGRSEPAAERMPGEATANENDPMAETRRNLDRYQKQLQALLDNLTKTAAAATNEQVSAPLSSSASVFAPTTTPLERRPSSSGALFGGQLQGSATPRVAAKVLPNRSLTLPKGTAFTCALKTRVVTAASGLVGCQVQRNVYSEDGRVLLIERGSHLDGEYRATSIKPGTVRIPVLWVRIRTPNGITVDLDSPATGPLGESGIDGYVDNRWPERIGAALLLSVIDDSVKLAIVSQGDSNGNLVLQSTTSETTKLAEKVLDSTINIPPLIYQNQGGIVGIYVARDVDFSSVYELRAVQR